jgi:hypothetical protein
MVRCLCVASLLACAGNALALQQAASGGPGPKVRVKSHDEGGPVMPPAAPRRLVYSQPYTPATDDVTILRQVNIGANGLNILGDAANEPSIMVDPSAPNRVTISWRQFDSVTSDFRQAGHAYSLDGGRTWTNPGVLTPGTFRSDPVIRSSPDGHECLVDIGDPNTFEIDDFESTDGGQNWSGPINARAGDKEWIAVDRTNLASRGFIYECWQTAAGAYRTTTFTRSTDNGQTWMNPIALTSGSTRPPIFGTLAVGPSGEFYTAGIQSGSSSTFRWCKSTNAGNASITPTFTTGTVNLGGAFGVPGSADPNPSGLDGQVWIDVDRSNGPRHGWVYIVATVYRGSTSPQDVVFVRSTDGGATWSAPINVNTDAPTANGWHWFGTLAVAPGGRIDVIWNDTRESQNVNLSRLYYSSSSDGGTTWTPNTALTTQYDTSLGWPQNSDNSQHKMGDYFDMVADDVGTSIAFAATFNGEEDVYFMRLGDWDCNSNGIPDTIDLANGTLHDCNGNGVPDECERAAGIIVTCPCYANCDGSTTTPLLNVNDFTCFLQKFSLGDIYANCDGSTSVPTLNVADFTCFLQKFAGGCP